MKDSVFEQLSALNLSDKTEKKNGLTYLSWAHAWAEAKRLFPNVQRFVYESETGMNYHTDGHTAWVKVGVKINDIEHIDYLPVMNHRNQSIKLTELTSFDVNKSIQRSTVKALALHGLALNIFAKEDFPDDIKPEPAKKPIEKTKLAIGDDNWEKVTHYIVDNMGIPTDQVIKNLSIKYIISDAVKKEIIKLKS
jgi:hypothetical protein